ncbi:MAG: serine hydrolase domain-containing protein [Fimbriimonadaceae bacterium]
MISTILAASLLNSPLSANSYEIDPKRLRVANDRLRGYIHAGDLAGAATLVMLDGKVVANDAFGWSDLESRKLMKRDTIYQVMSMTKPVTATAVMICVEKGLVSLDDPIENYLPHFKGIQVKGEDGVLRDAQTRPTIRHLLTHTSGLASDDPGGISDEDKARMGLDEYAKIVGTEPLRTQPGTVIRYSGVGFSTAAAIVQIASGVPFDQFVRTEIFNPLGMSETHFFLPVALRPRLAQVYMKDGGKLVPYKHDRFREGAKFANGAGGLYSTAADMGKFIDSFRDGSARTVLSPNSIKLMTSLNTGELMSDGNDSRGYGLSWSIIRNPMAQGTLRNLGSFGHTGAFGTEYWHDRDTGLTVVFMAQTFFIPENARKTYSTMVNASLLVKE